LTKNVAVHVGDVNKVIPNGFVIAVPPDWEEVDPSRPLQDARNLVPSGSPAATPTKTLAPVNLPLTLIAAAPSLSNGQILSTTVMVSKQLYPGGDLTTEQMATSIQRYRQETINASLVSSRYADLNGLAFAYLEMKHDVQVPNRDPETYSSVQYIYVKNQVIYVIEFNSRLDRTAELLPLFESIARTFGII
jgi:hypothetical protein